MSDKVIANKSDLVAIANAVRNKTGSTEEYNVSELSVAAIEAISSSEGGGTNVETCTVTLEVSGIIDNYISVSYGMTNGSLTESYLLSHDSRSIIVNKGSIIVFADCDQIYDHYIYCKGDIEEVYVDSSGDIRSYFVYGNGTITFVAPTGGST